MLMPDFTADSSVYQTSRSYSAHSAQRYVSAAAVVPQDLSVCGACTCDPGKCCYLSGTECGCGPCYSHVADDAMARLMVQAPG